MFDSIRFINLKQKKQKKGKEININYGRRSNRFFLVDYV